MTSVGLQRRKPDQVELVRYAEDARTIAGAGRRPKRPEGHHQVRSRESDIYVAASIRFCGDDFSEESGLIEIAGQRRIAHGRRIADQRGDAEDQFFSGGIHRLTITPYQKWLRPYLGYTFKAAVASAVPRSSIVSSSHPVRLTSLTLRLKLLCSMSRFRFSMNALC